jgi:hypothetical protein
MIMTRNECINKLKEDVGIVIFEKLGILYILKPKFNTMQTLIKLGRVFNTSDTFKRSAYEFFTMNDVLLLEYQTPIDGFPLKGYEDDDDESIEDSCFDEFIARLNPFMRLADDAIQDEVRRLVTESSNECDT